MIFINIAGPSDTTKVHKFTLGSCYNNTSFIGTLSGKEVVNKIEISKNKTLKHEYLSHHRSGDKSF